MSDQPQASTSIATVTTEVAAPHAAIIAADTEASVQLPTPEKASSPLMPNDANPNTIDHSTKRKSPYAPKKEKGSMSSLKLVPSSTGKHKRHKNDLDGRLASLYDHMGVTRKMLRSIPPTNSNEQCDRLPPLQRNALRRVFMKCTTEVAKLFFPHDGTGLLKEFVEHKSEQADLIRTVPNGIRVCKRGSIEKRVFMALLCASFKGGRVAQILHDSYSDDERENGEGEGAATNENNKYTNNNDTNSNANVNNNEENNNTKSSNDNNNNANAITNMINNSNHATMITNTTSTMNTNTINDHNATTNNSNSNTNNTNPHTDITNKEKGSITIIGDNKSSIKRPKLSGGFSRTFQRARTDWHNILISGGVPVTKLRRNRLKHGEITLRRAVRFIFQSKYIQLLPQTSRRVRINKEFKRFPYFYQRTSSENIWKSYRNECVSYDENNVAITQFGRSTFNRLLCVFIKHHPYSYDDKFYYLVKCNLKFLLRIVDNQQLIPNEPGNGTATTLRNQILDVQNFLQFQYPILHVNSSDGDVLHDIHFSLSTTINTNNDKNDDTVHTSKCKQCLACFQLIKNIASSCVNVTDDLKFTLKDCENKLLLYMAYQHRCAYQENQLTQLFQYVRNDVPRKSVILFLNYKLKFDVSKFRASTDRSSASQSQSVMIQNGKDVYWRSSCVFYRPEQHEQKEKGIGDQDQLYTLHLNHIITNEQGDQYDNEADENEILYSLLDCVLYNLKKQPAFKELKNVWVVTNKPNSISTKNTRMKCINLAHVILPFIAHKHDIHLRGLIYPENNKAKILFDGHFLIAMKSIHKYFSTLTSSPCTADYPYNPKYVFKALRSLSNASTNLITISSNGSRSRLHEWINNVNGDSGNGGIHQLKRFHEFYYGEITSDVIIVVCYRFPGDKPQRFVFGKYYTNKLPSNEFRSGGDVNDAPSSEDEVDVHASERQPHSHSQAQSMQSIHHHYRHHHHHHQQHRSQSSSDQHQHHTISNHELNSLLNLTDEAHHEAQRQQYQPNHRREQHQQQPQQVNQMNENPNSQGHASSFTSQPLSSLSIALGRASTQMPVTASTPTPTPTSTATERSTLPPPTTPTNKYRINSTTPALATSKNIYTNTNTISNNDTDTKNDIPKGLIGEEIKTQNVYNSTETNVSILCEGDMCNKNSKRVRKIRPETAIFDAAAELDLDLDGDTSDDEIDMIDAEGNMIPTINESALPQCSKCLRVFKKDANRKVHEEQCTNDVKKGSLADQAKALAFELLKQQLNTDETTNEAKNELYYNPLLERNKKDKEEIELEDDTANEHGLKKGWARRSKLGGNMGKNLIHHYIEDIKQIFALWTSDRNGKISASLVKDALHAKYPHRYDIPNEYHIHLAILQLGGITLDDDKVLSSSLDYDEAHKQGVAGYLLVAPKYANCLRDMVLENRKFRPRHAKATLIEKLNLDPHNLPGDFPTERTIRNKVSTLKTQLY